MNKISEMTPKKEQEEGRPQMDMKNTMGSVKIKMTIVISSVSDFSSSVKAVKHRTRTSESNLQDGPNSYVIDLCLSP